ncbi:MAG TPA: CpaF family protein [Thermaerobacter sp.]
MSFSLYAQRWTPAAPDKEAPPAAPKTDMTQAQNGTPPARAPQEDSDQDRERDILRRIRGRLTDRLHDGMDEREAAQIAKAIVLEETAELPKARREAILQEILLTLGGRLGPLQPYLDDPSVTEIMVNAPDQVYIERDGQLQLVPVRFRDDEHVIELVERIVGEVGRRFDLTNPMVDARLPDGSRVNAIRPPLALRGTAVTIRKFPRAFTFDQLVAMGAIPAGEDGGFNVAEALRWAVRNRLNIVVSGGTGSGKTTMLNALTGLIPDGDRLVIIEDAAELQPQQPHVVRLETRPPNTEGQGEVKIRDLVVNALRMRPDRIIVGEVRSSEVVDMLQAMNTGHPGSLTTVHANSTRDALTRLEMMVLMAGVEVPLRAVRQLIASAVQLLVHVARTRLPNGDTRRWITEVTAIRGLDPQTVDYKLEVLYRRELPKQVRLDVPEWAREWFEGGER